MTSSSVDALVRLLLQPGNWLLGASVAVLVLVFATSVVLRRDPPVWLLLGFGLLAGLAYLPLEGRLSYDFYATAEQALVAAGVAWTVLAMPVVLASLLQPGAPKEGRRSSSIALGRLARHFLPALLGALLLTAYDPHISWVALPWLAISLGAGRTEERPRQSWRTGTLLLAANVALVGTVTLCAVPFDRGYRIVFLLEAWTGALVLLAWLEQRERSILRYFPVFALLCLLGALFEAKNYGTQAQILWYARSLELPSCNLGHSYSVTRDAPVRLADVSLSELVPDQILVSDAGQDIAPLLKRRLLLACWTPGGRHPYAAVVINEGVAIPTIRVDGKELLADGQEARPGTMRHILGTCVGYKFLPRLATVWGESMTTAQVVEMCGRTGCYAATRTCVYTPELGWHLQQ